MFQRIRQIHLFAAFVLTAFILMYFVSGLVMIFGETFKRTDTSVDSIVKVVPGIHTFSNDHLLSALRENFDLGGQYTIQRRPAKISVSFRHPGTEANAVIATGTDSVSVTIKKKNFVAVLHQFHRQHGYSGGLNYMLWAFFYDLSACSMIVFAITGVYLWYKNEREKWPGLLILFTFTLFTAFTIYYLNNLT